MKNNNITSFIVFSGLFVLCVFTVVIVYNLLPDNKESNSYYVKVDEELREKIQSVYVENDNLNIKTYDGIVEFCVKSTKTLPEPNSLCWKKIENNSGSSSIYQHKKYYLWIKDVNGKISNSTSINPRD